MCVKSNFIFSFLFLFAWFHMRQMILFPTNYESSHLVVLLCHQFVCFRKKKSNAKLIRVHYYKKKSKIIKHSLYAFCTILSFFLLIICILIKWHAKSKMIDVQFNIFVYLLCAHPSQNLLF